MASDSPDFDEILATMLRNTIIRDSYRLTLWANFFNGPAFARIEREFSILRDEYNVLACLATFGPMVATSVCMLTGRPKNSVSRGVGRLLQRDLITRTTETADRRRALLSIRPAGRELYEKIVPIFTQREAAMLCSLSAQDRQALDSILTRLMKAHKDWVSEY